MLRMKMIAWVSGCLLTIAMLPVVSSSQEKVEGTVLSTNLTSCSVVPGKVGTCEGTLVLESKDAGKTRQMTVKITRDTTLKKGDEKLFLFQLQGGFVTINFTNDKGEKIAQSVLMKSQK
jgi:hypothetical protein